MYICLASQRNIAPQSAASLANRTAANGKEKARLMRTAALIAMMAISFWLGAQIHANAAVEAGTEAAPGIAQPYVLHAVEPGETLWAIAKSHLPEGAELAAFIHAIRQFNGMETSGLLAGQVLKIPVHP